ncbi:hypothetical protein [Methylocapsa sp. S129]|uniref:hypothetical protein n=1 Tax=Methylocapsa sp. S129 TaxID=1641869 RepID=UPI00131BC3B3|nr:hypothetical protein [Methylocapsa sp. S129]
MNSFETPKSRTMPVADLLQRIADELRDLTQVVDNLQSLVGRLVAASAIRDGDAMRELQNFDRLGQNLSGVANFAEALGGAAPEDWLVNPHSASRAVHLSDLAARLVSQGARGPASDPAGAGELEFF